MTSSRIHDLQKKLERNRIRVLSMFENITAEGWGRTVYANPTAWTVRDLLAHFVSAEKVFLDLSKNIAAGGKGAPEGFDYNEFNRKEKETYQSFSAEELIRMFNQSRESILEWMNGLTDEQLDRKGRHPALGEVSLESILAAIHGHILLHLRDL